jgi:DNA (cytosine-5)-methyltransferase 1
MTGDLVHIDLFAGPGGFSAGLRAAGYRTVVGVEQDAVAASSFRLNFPETEVIERDVRAVSGWDLIRHLPHDGVRYLPADLLTASPPCEVFSTAGTRTRLISDERLWLFREAVRLAVAVQARCILLENVPGVLNRRAGHDLVVELLRRELDKAGYTNQIEDVLDASKYGVPQVRRRWFLLAARDPELRLGFPEPATAETPVTVRDAFAGLPLHAGSKEYEPDSSPYADLMRNSAFWRLPRHDGCLTHHEAARAGPRQVARYSLVRQGGRVEGLFRGVDPDVVASLQSSGVLPEVPFKQSGQRLHPQCPSPTVTATATDRLLHFRVNRGITVREAARLQSFPDGFRFWGGLYERYGLVGQAVPPLIAYRLGLAVREMLTGGPALASTSASRDHSSQ